MNGSLIEVVAIDEEHKTVELQFFDGTIDSLELEVWRDTDVEPAQAPEDWSGSVDIDPEDRPEADYRTGNCWRDPMVFFDRYE